MAIEQVAGVTRLNWASQAGATGYDVAGDDLFAAGTASASCLENDVAGATWDDPRPDPTAGAGYFYMIRGENVCGAGSYGDDSAGSERTPTSACP